MAEIGLPKTLRAELYVDAPRDLSFNGCGLLIVNPPYTLEADLGALGPGLAARLAQGPGTGRALLFNNIKNYNKPKSRGRRVFGSALNNNRRIAMMLGLPPDTHARELVKIGRTILQEGIPPRMVNGGPCKENVVTGKDVNVEELPEKEL